MTRQIMVGFSLSSGSLVLSLLSGTGAQARDAAIALVNVEELKPQYESCGVVEFSVRNTSQQDVYVEVYAEDLEGDFWKNVALRDRLMHPKRSADLTVTESDIRTVERARDWFRFAAQKLFEAAAEELRGRMARG